MGITSTLFFDSNDSEKQTLHRRITPSDDQFQEQQERWNHLAEHLIADLKKQSDCQVRTWLQGSYKFGTQVRPSSKGREFDIDLGVYFEWKGAPNEGRHGPQRLKQIVQQSLNDYTGESVIEVSEPPKSRCSRIRFDGDFHIDVPAYHLDPARNARSLATSDNIWEDSDPKAFYLWFKNAFEDYRRSKARRQIRYFKAWAGLSFSGESCPSSTLLTVLVAEAFQNLSDDKTVADDDTLLAVLEELVQRLRTSRAVFNPANLNEDLMSRLKKDAQDAFLDGLVAFQGIASRALECDSELAGANTWAEAFFHFMPLPEVETEGTSKTAKQNASLPALLNMPDVRIVAVSRTNAHFQWEGTNRIGPIPKDCDIRFSIVSPEKLPLDAVITWTVRNTQQEAEETNDLGHKAGVGFEVSERSAYKGIHYMDCSMSRYGQLVGIRRIPVEVNGTFVPRRNPQKKPFWRGIAGRR